MPGAYSFPLLSEAFCDLLVAEAERMAAHVEGAAANSSSDGTGEGLLQRLHHSGSLVPVLGDMG